jgi:hypothetical protein
MEEQVQRIKGYVKQFTTINQGEESLLEYSIEAVIDRLLLFLGVKELNKQFERVVADVVSKVFHKYKKDKTSGPAAQIQTISDNGQSITYADQMRNYLMTSTDNELFSGVIELLKVYRKPKVVRNETN